MVIKNLTSQYYVIEKKKSNKDFDILYCRLMDSGGNKTFDMLRIKNRERIPFLIQTFTESENNQTFYDLHDCFSKNGCFYIVFVHSDSISLKEKLERENCILRERLEIGKNLLEKLIILAMPEFLQAEVMNPEKVLVASDLTVSFSYEIDSVNGIEGMDFQMVMAGIAQVMEVLFEKELTNRESEDIEKFIKLCHEYHFCDIMEFFQEYTKFYEVVSKQWEGGYISPHTFLFRIWEKIKKGFLIGRKWFFKIILIILVVFMIKYILTEDKKSGTDFSQIGTVQIGAEEDAG